MNALERLLDWAQHATPREQWRMERDLDGIGVPYAVDEQGRKQRGVVSLELPAGEDAEYLWALIQAAPDLLKAIRALAEEECGESGTADDRCWDADDMDWPRGWWCRRCTALEPLLREDER